MRLSDSFTIDPDAPWVRAHNAEVRAVLDGWERGRPPRVPLLCEDYTLQHGVYAAEAGVDYERYYTDPDEMVRVQLEAARRRRELPWYDLELGVLPESWPISVDFHPVFAPAWLGCEIVYRRDAVPAQVPRGLSRDECDAMAMPDPQADGILDRLRAFTAHIERHWLGREFLDRPIGPLAAGLDHNGVLAMALDLRGPDLLADCYEDPPFVRRFLLKMAEWCDALERAWPSPWSRGYFRNTDHGIDLLSPEMYEDFVLPVIVEMNRRRGTGLPTGWHYCGGGMHLVPVFAAHYPLERIDDLTHPLLDIARIRQVVGDAVRLKVQVADGIVHAGPPQRIRETVRELLTSAAALPPGKLCLTAGDLMGGVPQAHREALYAAIREFGTY